MMLDDVGATSPSSVYRVLRDARHLDPAPPKKPLKAAGFVQPLQPHQHWHTAVAYLNIAGTFYFLISVLDAYSRMIVHWEIRERMTERDVAIERARQHLTQDDPAPPHHPTTNRSSWPAISKNSSASPA